MPQEPYWEVMSYFDAKKQAVMQTTALVTNIGATAADVAGQLLLAKAGLDLGDSEPQIQALLGKHMALAELLKDMPLEDISLTIADYLNQDQMFSVEQHKRGLGQGVGSLHANLWGMFSGTDTLMGGLNGIIQNVGINPFIQRNVNQRTRPNIPDAQTAWLMHRIGWLPYIEYKAMTAQNGWTDDWITQLDQVWQQPLPIGILLDLYRRNLITIEDLQWQLRLSRFDEDRIDGLTALKTQYPEPYRLAEMHTKALVGNDEYLATTRIFGLDDWWATRWSDAQVRYPDFNTALALLRRGDIDDTTFYFWMQMQQVQPEETDVMLKLKDVIPPIQDLIRFAVREAYGDHTSEVQYSTMVDIAKKMGLTAEASEWYWYAHWDRIPVNLMFANYHRGLWDVTKLERMLKIVDMHPDDRSDIINVAYGPPNVRELGYGWDVGEYTEEDIAKYRRFGGLSPEDAGKAAASLVAYRTEGERNSVRTELMYAFGFERIDEDTLRLELEALNTPQEAIELWVTRAELYRERMKKPTTDTEGRIVSGAEALAAFKLGIRDESWTRQALADLDWTADRIDVAIEKAKIDIAAKIEEPVVPKYRGFTVADIKNFYKLHLIDKEQMEVELIIIGYSPDDAAVLTEVFTTEPDVTPQPKAFTSSVAANLYNLMIFDEEDLYNNFLDEGYDTAQAGLLLMYTQLIQKLPDLQAMYQKGIVTGEYVVTELKKMEVPEYNARLLVKKITDQYQIDRLTTEKDLTKAEIIKGVKNQVLTTVQGVSLLIDIGYDSDEAYYILAINKLVEASDPEGYWDMKRVTENLKKARGEKYMEVPETMITLERQIKQTKLQLEEMKKKGESEDKIAEKVLELGRFENEMRTLITQKKLA
jgi:hypothetical protein